MNGLLAAGGAGVAVIILIILFWQGGTGRLGIALAAAAGSALAICATIWAVLLDVLGMIAQFAASLGSGFG